MDPIILASQSPRRRELLSFFSLPFIQVTSGFDEESLPYNCEKYTLNEYPALLATHKCRTVAAKYPHCTILGADTVVYTDCGKMLAKPVDESQALQFLQILRGRWHSVYTGITLYADGNYQSQTGHTRVLFANCTDNQLERYIALGTWRDKAAGYGLQGGGSLLIERVDGCFYNVMGLPLLLLAELLTTVKIDLWSHLKAM